jgi:hypothetical protein
MCSAIQPRALAVIAAMTAVACGGATTASSTGSSSVRSPTAAASTGPGIGEACDAVRACSGGAVCVDVAASGGRLHPAAEILERCEGADEEESECPPPRASYCDLPSARRPMLPEEGLLAFAAGGLVHAVVGRADGDGPDREADEGYETPTAQPAPRQLGHVDSTMVIGRRAEPTDAGEAPDGLLGRVLRIANADGTSCEGAVSDRWLVERLREGWYEGAEEDADQPQRWEDRAILRTLVIGASACADPVFVRAADLPPVAVASAEADVDPSLASRARRAFSELEPARLLEESARRAREGSGEAPEPDAHWWSERGPWVARFVVGDVARVVVSASGGHACDGFAASLTVVLREGGGDAPLVVESIAHTASMFHHALDVDDDGRIELIGSPTANAPYDEVRLVSPTLSTTSQVEITWEPC